MAIGRISGSVLKSNMTRNGVDLAFETNLLYLDVTNSRVGIGTSEPATALQVNGTVTATAMAVTGSTATINSKDIMVGKSEGTNFTGSLLVGHATSGTLSTAIRNTGVGIVALDALTSGDNNTAVGYNAGTTITSGSSNTAIGSTALVTTNGDNNTAVGHLAMRDATSGGANVAIGSQAGLTMSGGSAAYNIVIGHQAGDNISSGAGNIVIGSADVDSATDNRQLVIAGNDGSSTTTWIKGTSAGAITFNSAYTFPTADGSAGQQLTTDGSGTVTWADVDGSSDISITGNEIKTTTSNSTLDLKANGTGDINLTAGADVNIPANIGLTFGDDGEKIEGDGTDLTITSSNDVTIDAAGDIFLDAAGNEVKILNAGTELARFVNNSRNFQIKNPNQDKDIIIQGNDGGSNVDALTLDMSEAGAATFNSTIATTGLTINSAYTLPTSDGSAGQQLTTDGSGTVTWADVDGSSNISFSGTTMASDGALTLDATTDITLDAGGADILLKDDGTAFGGFSNSSTDLAIKAGTTPTTVLTLSSNGSAEFENISIVDNTITTTASNSDLQLNTAGSGVVTLNGLDAMYGKIEGTNFTGSLLLGHGTTGTLSSADYNTGVGIGTLDALTSGDSNTAIGHDAGTLLTTAEKNSFVGRASGASLTTGSGNNTGLGYSALYSTNTGAHNIAIGSNAGQNITSGSGNIIIGGINASSATGSRQLMIAGYDGTNTTTWIKGTSGGAITFNNAFTFPSGDGSANQVLQTDGSGNVSWGNVSVDSLATGAITYDDNKITGQRSNENIEISANGTGVIETSSSIIPKTDNSIDLGSSSKRFREGYFAAGTVHIGDQTIKSTATGFVFSGSVSTKGASLTKNDDSTSSVIKKTGIADSESTVESYATSVNDSVLYYIVARDEVNDMVTAQKVITVHNNSTGFASTTHVTKTGSSTDMTFDGSISGGAMRLRATGGSFSNSISAYKIALGDNHSSGTSGNTAIIINADVDSATENLDTWAHASYRGAKYFISVNDEADDELETLEAMVTHNGSGAFITVYNNVRTGSTGLITLTADISGANVRLRGTGSRANLNVKMHRILLADDENAFTGNQMAIIPATTISSSATAIDTFNVNDIHGAFYYVTSTIANGDSCMAEVVVATDGTDAYATTGPIISSEGTDQLSFAATISGDVVTISAASSSGASTTVNAYRINLKRDAETNVTNTVSLNGTQTISGAKTFSAPIVLNTTTTDDSLTITTTEASDSAAPVISLKRNSSSPADADYLGQIKFKGENDADQEVNYAKISGKILDASDGSEDGILEFAFAKGGSQNISARFRSDSLQLLNETSFRVAGGHAEFGVLASDPGGSAGYAKIYAKDESSSAEMFVQDEAGNVTKISPHNEEGEWEYYSRNTKTGKTVRVNMEEMIRDIEKLTGKSYIKNS